MVAPGASGSPAAKGSARPFFHRLAAKPPAPPERVVLAAELDELARELEQ